MRQLATMTDTPQPFVSCDIIDELNSLTEEQKAASLKRAEEFTRTLKDFGDIGMGGIVTMFEHYPS